MFRLFKPHFARAPRKRIVTPQTIVVGGHRIDAKLIQSPAARTVRFKVSVEDGLEIVVPYRFDLSNVPRMIRIHEEWILRHVHKTIERKKLRAHTQLHDGSIITVLGEPTTVRIINVPRHRPQVKKVQQLKFLEDRAIVDGHEFHVFCDGTVKHAKQLLEKYFRGIAEKYFLHRTRDLAEQMNLTFNNITIRGQKTRWGSCTRAKNLNFNWRLILTPLPVLDSVIIHELAHTVFMNHSKAFYALVEAHCPEYRKLQKHLRNPQFSV